MSKPTSTRGALPTGYASEIVISESTFRSAHRAGLSSASSASVPGASNITKKRKREQAGDAAVVTGPGAYRGPWAPFKARTPPADSDGSEEEIEVTDSEAEVDADADAQAQTQMQTAAGQRLPPLVADYAPDVAGETSEFNGSSERDYLGRTYMHVPPDLRGEVDEDLKNYVPKKISHSFKQQMGTPVTQMRYFPGSGHLLLTASGSGKVRLYDTLTKDGHSRELLRTYMGHNKSCNDIDFNNDGVEFLTASYDRQMKLWDTETGQCKSKYSTGKTPHVIRFNPANNNEFVCGTVDKKIVQFDARTRDIVQEYDHHLGPVNTITFCDGNRRFITTSDDRSLRAWEYGIPVPIKFVADPDMFSMNRSTTHPKKPFVALQSSDNQIVVYASSEKFRQNRKKGFRGHNNSGYAIDVDISTDGELVMSGDTGGFVCFWSWKTCKMIHKLQAGDSAVISCQFNPRDTSECVTADVDGLIRLWK